MSTPNLTIEGEPSGLGFNKGYIKTTPGKLKVICMVNYDLRMASVYKLLFFLLQIFLIIFF